MNKKILIIDDDPNIRDMFRLVLESEDYEIISAGNGQEALEILKTQELPALILLDLMMPVMNGWEFAEAIKEVPPIRSIPIVTISAYDPKGLKVDGYLQKPTTVDDILNCVQKFIPLDGKGVRL